MIIELSECAPERIVVEAENAAEYVSIECETGPGECDGLWQQSLTIDEAERVAAALLAAASHQRQRLAERVSR